MTKVLNTEFLGSNGNISTLRARNVDEKPGVFLVEKDSLVANELGFELEIMGMEVSGITGSLVEALKQIEEKKLIFVLLNIQLDDGESYPVAKRLTALGIPFGFFTSFDADEIHPEFRHVPRLSKPQDTATIARFISGLSGRFGEHPFLSLSGPK